MPSEEKIVKAHCNRCLRETSHLVLCEREESTEDEVGFRWSERHEMLLCRGCENVTFRKVEELPDELVDIDPDTGNRDTNLDITYYPPLSSRREPSWLEDLRGSSGVLRSLLKEIYIAFHSGARTLAAAGIRTLIDATMTAKVRDQGNFARTLDAFEREGFIARKQVDVLKRTIDAGSASAHRAFTPSKKDLEILLDIAENLIENVFIHPAKMKAAARRVPKRPRRRKPVAVQLKKATP